MQNSDSKIIIERFFQALQTLKDEKIIRGKQTFTTRYGINRWNMNTLEKEPDRDIFQVAWLQYLAQDYMISTDWLVCGEGGFFKHDWDVEKVKNLQKTCKSNLMTL